MDAKGRKKAFKAYLEEAYRPFLTNAGNVLKMYVSLSSSLNTIHPEYSSVFDLDDSKLLVELLNVVRNPPSGAMAFGRRVQHLDLKESFIKHYAAFLDGIKQEERAIIEVEEQKETEFLEGQLKEIRFFKRKRSKALRDECIRKYGGYKCYVCGFDFEAVYGERGKEFIEVHHLNPMANYDDEHPITADELRPLCSNCHSMIHKDPLGGVTEIEIFKADYLRRNKQ